MCLSFFPPGVEAQDVPNWGQAGEELLAGAEDEREESESSLSGQEEDEHAKGTEEEDYDVSDEDGECQEALTDSQGSDSQEANVDCDSDEGSNKSAADNPFAALNDEGDEH